MTYVVNRFVKGEFVEKIDLDDTHYSYDDLKDLASRKELVCCGYDSNLDRECEACMTISRGKNKDFFKNFPSYPHLDHCDEHKKSNARVTVKSTHILKKFLVDILNGELDFSQLEPQKKSLRQLTNNKTKNAIYGDGNIRLTYINNLIRAIVQGELSLDLKINESVILKNLFLYSNFYISQFIMNQRNEYRYIVLERASVTSNGNIYFTILDGNTKWIHCYLNLKQPLTTRYLKSHQKISVVALVQGNIFSKQYNEDGEMFFGNKTKIDNHRCFILKKNKNGACNIIERFKNLVYEQ